MERPTREQVDHVLESIDEFDARLCGDEQDRLMTYAVLLVREVRALQATAALPDLHRADVLRLERENEKLREENARMNRELEMHTGRGLDRSYAYAIGQIESVLVTAGAPPLAETVDRVRQLAAKLARVEALLPVTCCAGTAHGDLVLAIHKALRGETKAECTGLAATWCPIHGDCTCPRNAGGERTLNYINCPLHGSRSAHAEDSL